MENKAQDVVPHKRHAERRGSTRMAPPPYYTREGKVLTDRRSAIDRRATWIREFSLEASSGSEA